MHPFRLLKSSKVSFDFISINCTEDTPMIVQKFIRSENVRESGSLGSRLQAHATRPKGGVGRS